MRDAGVKRTRSNPPLPAVDRRQSMAVNHVAKFVADELVIEPRAFLRLSALGRIYHDWVELHGVMNRRVSASELLLRLELDYGLSCGMVYLNAQDATSRTLYGLRGARLRLPELNARRRYGDNRGRPLTGATPAAWKPVVDGSIPDIAERFANERGSEDVGEEDM